MKTNQVKYITSQAIMACVNVFITGTVLQTFLLESGVGEHMVSAFESTFLIVQSLVMALSSGMIEKMKNTINAYAVTSTLRGIVMLPMLVFCVVRGIPVWWIFAIIALFKLTGVVFEGIYSVVLYKFPYHIMEMKDYGRITAVSGLVSGILATVFSAMITYLNGKTGFFEGMKYVLCFGIIVVIFGFIIAKGMERNGEYENNVISSKIESEGSIFRYKPFYILLIPNLCRGICTGVLNVAVVIGYHFKLIDGGNAIIATVILQIATILGAILYAKLCNKNIDGKLILVASLVALVAMPFMTSFGTGAFFGAFLVSRLAVSIIDNVVPVAVVKIVDYTHIGRYSAWRMIIHTLGTALGSGIAIVMADTLGGIATMIITGLCMVICGAAYYICLKLYGHDFCNTRSSSECN